MPAPAGPRGLAARRPRGLAPPGYIERERDRRRRCL